MKDIFSIIATLLSPLAIYVPHVLRLFKVKVPEDYIFPYYILLFLGVFLGESIGIYLMTYWWDKIVHAFSGVLLFIWGLAIVYKQESIKSIKKNLTRAFVFAFFFAIFIECCWELFEIGNDTIIGTNMLQDGTRDTTLDMTFEAFGAIIGSILAYITLNVKKIWILDIYLKNLRP